MNQNSSLLSRAYSKLRAQQFMYLLVTCLLALVALMPAHAALDTTAALAELASADVSVQAIFGGMIVVIALMFVISKVRSLLKA